MKVTPVKFALTLPVKKLKCSFGVPWWFVTFLSIAQKWVVSNVYVVVSYCNMGQMWSCHIIWYACLHLQTCPLSPSPFPSPTPSGCAVSRTIHIVSEWLTSDTCTIWTLQMLLVVVQHVPTKSLRGPLSSYCWLKLIELTPSAKN